jgi:hypothetical protein
VSVSFDSPTNRAGATGATACQSLLRFSGDTSALCLWASDANLRIYPGPATTAASGGVLGVNSTITVLGGKVRARCTAAFTPVACLQWSAVILTSAQVLAPAEPVSPSVVISAPSSVGACNALTLDLSSSTGAAGRLWKRVTFEVRTAFGATSGALQRFLLHNYTMTPPTPIPPVFLMEGQQYSIQATLCNFLDACGTSTKTVSVTASDKLMPIASILGSASRSVLRKETLVLNSDAYTQSCTGIKSYRGLSYN